jgi:hypothetical protein
MTNMIPVDFMTKLPTEELKAQFFKELMAPISDPLAPLPSSEEQTAHREALYEKFKDKIGDL